MKKIMITILGGMLLMTGLTGCSDAEKDYIKERTQGKTREEIQAGLSDFTNLYPTKNLMDFFDKEGIRSGLKPEDKGTWTVSSSYSYEINKELHGYHIVLFFNRNTGKAEGEYSYTIYKDNFKSEEKERIAIYYDKTGLHAKDNKILPEKIQNYRFLVQYVSLQKENLNKLDLKEKMYNPEVPLYDLTYILKEGDKNLGKIKNNFPKEEIGEKPTLVIEGDGSFGGGIDTERTLRINFKNSNDFSIDESITFDVSKEFNGEN